MKEKTHMFYLSVGKFRRVFRLGIPLTTSSESKPGVDIRLKMLRRKLDAATIKGLLDELSKILGFKWVKDANVEGEFTWGSSHQFRASSILRI